MKAIARFEIVEELGRGSHGVVYRARDPELDRELAIKVMPLAEIEGARAMAGLQHPSVMPVFDVGELDGEVYVVMPLVSGGTLEAWLAAEPRPWREVLARFMAAGRGLAAAHAAELRHGDFHPRNVLLGRGGEVRVADFGVVATGDDVRDFCASLRDALRDQPAWLSAAVEARWPSMQALLDHLERRLRRPRRIALGVGAVAVAGVAAGVVLVLPSKRAPVPPPCPDPVARVAAVWNPAIRTRIEQAFAASGSPIAADTVGRILPILDRYGDQWRAAHVASCQATHVARTQTVEVLDKRSVCLERRLAALRGMADALTSADKALVEKAPMVVPNLPRIDDCADDEAMLAQQPLPADPAARAAIAALDERIDALDAQMIRGAPAELVEKSRPLVAESRTIDYLPLQVRALHLHVKLLGVVRADLETEVRELAALGARAKDDVIIAYAWGRLMEELVQKGRQDDARQLVPVAEAALERVEGSSKVAFNLAMALGNRAANLGELAPATGYYTKAVRVAGDRRELRIGALRNLAYTLLRSGKRDEALPLIEEAVAMAREIFGPDHPRYADVLEYRATILVTGGGDDDARGFADSQDVLRIRLATYGENHPATAEILHNLAIYNFNANRLDEAEAYIARCVAVLEKVPAPLTVGGAIGTQADIVYKRRGLDAARPLYERALAETAKANGERSMDYTSVEIYYAQRLIDGGECRRARALAGHAERVLGETGSITLAGALLQLSRCDRLEGKHDAAIRRLERAVTICTPESCEPTDAAIDRRELGKALVETGRDRARGYALVQDALATFRAGGPEHEGNVAGLETWLKKHPPP